METEISLAVYYWKLWDISKVDPVGYLTNEISELKYKYEACSNSRMKLEGILQSDLANLGYL